MRKKNLKTVLLLIISLLPYRFLLSQEVVFSPDENYMAVCFELSKDSLVYIPNELGSELGKELEFSDKKTQFAKYKIAIFDAQKNKELFSYQSLLYQKTNSKSLVKMQFDQTNQNLLVAIQNDEVLHFNTHKGLVNKYKAQDFCFDSQKVNWAILKPQSIYFSDTGKEIERDFSGFTHLKWFNEFVVVSRYAKNKFTGVILERLDAKNNKIFKGETWAFNPIDNELISFNSGKFQSYKLPSLKEKEVELDNDFRSAEFKKRFYLAQFNSSGDALFLVSNKKLSVFSAKGKVIAETEIPENFTKAFWTDLQNIQIATKNQILIFNYSTKKLSKEVEFDFNYSKYSIENRFRDSVKIVSNSLKYSVQTLKKGFLIKNNITNEEKRIENEDFLCFNEKESFIFTKNNPFEYSKYETTELFKQNQPSKIKTDDFKMLFPLSNLQFKDTSLVIHSPDLSKIALPYFYIEKDTFRILNEKVNAEMLYQAFLADSTLPCEKVTLQSKISNLFALFDVHKQEAQNITVNQQLVYSSYCIDDANFFNNPLLREEYFNAQKEKYHAQLANSGFLALERGKLAAYVDFVLINQNSYILKQNGELSSTYIDFKNNSNFDFLPQGKRFLSPLHQFLVIASPINTFVYNLQKGKVSRKYNDAYKNIILTDDTTFFIGLNAVGNYEWVGIEKKIDLKTSTIKISKNGKFLIAVQKDKVNVKLYSLPLLEEIKSAFLDESFKKYFYSPHINLSNDGSFFSAKYKNNLAIFSTQNDNTDQNTFVFENINENLAVLWLAHHHILVPKEEGYLLFDAKNKTFDMEKDFNFYISDPFSKEYSQSNYLGFVNENGTLAAAQFSSKHQNLLILKNTQNKDKQFSLINTKFVAFDDKNQKIYVQQGNLRIGIIDMQQLFLPDTKDLFIKSIKPPRGGNRTLPPNPAPFVSDFTPPKDYHYERFVKKIPFSEIKNNSVGMYTHSLLSQSNQVRLNFHLFDKNGHFYSGVSPENKEIWCELYIKYPDGSVHKIENFEVNEVQLGDDESTQEQAVVLVLDHSGSMGAERCTYLQRGAKAFVEQKTRNTALSILKFDHNVITEVPLTIENQKILQTFKLSADKGFGGSTALYDAVYDAVFETNALAKAKNKSVIVVTDGYENCSYTYLNELILFALENKVKIHTVGFGDFINKPILQTIAYQTGGSFHQIYSTKDFIWIYQDIFNKFSNFYTLHFATPQTGKYSLLLKACDKRINNQLLIAFDNNDIEFKKIYEYQQDGFGIPFIDMSDSMSIEDFQNPQPIANIENLVSRNGSNESFYIPREFDKIKFPDIKFVTDKTEIIKNSDKGLDDVISFMKKYTSIILEISGHTDEVGTDEKNMNLSWRRAEKVKEIMINAGIATNRIVTVGYGETKPIASNATSEGKQKNRRVEFKIVQKIK